MSFNKYCITLILSIISSPGQRGSDFLVSIINYANQEITTKCLSQKLWENGDDQTNSTLVSVETRPSINSVKIRRRRPVCDARKIKNIFIIELRKALRFLKPSNNRNRSLTK